MPPLPEMEIVPPTSVSNKFSAFMKREREFENRHSLTRSLRQRQSPSDSVSVSDDIMGMKLD